MSPARIWSDEELSAFLDAALPEPEAEALRLALTEDESLQERLLALEAVDAGLKAAFAAPMEEPVPARFSRLIEADQALSSSGGSVVDLASRRRPLSGAPQRFHLPLAAGIALVIGAFGGAQFGRGGDHAIAQLEATVITPANPLHRVLDTSPSATLVSLGGADAAKPVLSFRDSAGRLCREFEVASDTAVSLGVACRVGAGPEADWRLEILLPAADRPAGETGYVQASGYEAAALDAVLTRLGAGEPLDAAAEQAALSAQ